MKPVLILLLSLAIIQHATAQDVTVTVFDVGAGLCVLGEFPNEADSTDSYYMIYDAGLSCDDKIQSEVPIDEQIDLMVLSHNDTDHIATADHILDMYDINKVIWSGFERPDTDQWVDINEAIDNETGAEIINLRTDTLHIGTTYLFGQTYLTFVAGFYIPIEEWGFTPLQSSEYRNAGSIVMRIVFRGSSIHL